MWPLPETAMDLLSNCCLIIYTLRGTIIPLVSELRISPHQNDLTRTPVAVNVKRQSGKRTVPWHPGCLARSVGGVFYIVAAKQRQRNVGGGKPGSRSPVQQPCFTVSMGFYDFTTSARNFCSIYSTSVCRLTAMSSAYFTQRFFLHPLHRHVP